MGARFTVEPNGAGGWVCWDKVRRESVASSAFRGFIERAALRLAGPRDAERDDWDRYYGVHR
jgi:hypothetical protein